MAKKPPKAPLSQWIPTAAAIWLVFLTLSPFLVTITGVSAISALREVLLIAIVAAAISHRTRLQKPFIADDLEQIIAWIIALAIISTLFITRDIGAFVWSARYSLEPFMIFWALRSLTFDSATSLLLVRRWIYWALAIVVIGILFVTVVPRETLLAWGYSDTVAVGGGQWVGGATLPAYQTVAGAIPRLQSTLTGPIQFAGFALLLVFLLPILPSNIKKQWYAAALLVAVLGVLGSFSRAAWIALILLAIITGLRRLRRFGWQRAEIVALCIIIGVFSVAAVGSWLTRPDAEAPREFVANVLTRDGSDREHVSSITDSVRNVGDVWITGYGFGRSGAASIQYAAANSSRPAPRFVDNSYLRWAEELGVLGALLFIALIWLLIADLNRTGTILSRGLALAGSALAITAIFTDMWLEAVPVLTFFALCGLALHPRTYNEQPSQVAFDGLTLSRLSLHATVAQLTTWAHQVAPRHVITLNPEMIVAAWSNPALKKALTQADHITADGAGIVAAVTVGNRPLPSQWWLHNGVLLGRWVVSGVLLVFAPRHLNPAVERVTGSDLLSALMTDAHTAKRRVALLGSTPEVLARAKENIRTRWPHARVVFAETGPHALRDDGTLTESEARALIGKINHAKPQYLFVAFGVPKQELFIAHYKKRLNVPVMIGVSGAFDSVLARSVRRAPSMLQRLNIEWLWRVIRQPARMNRIITALVRFPIAYSRRLRRTPHKKP